MNQLEITNLLLKKAYLSGLDVDVELSIYESIVDRILNYLKTEHELTSHLGSI